MQSRRLLALSPWLSLAIAAFAACSGTNNQVSTGPITSGSGSSAGGTSTQSGSGTGTAASGAGTTTTSGAGSGTVSSGTPTGGSGTTTTGTGTSAGGAASGTTSGTGTAGAASGSTAGATGGAATGAGSGTTSGGSTSGPPFSGTIPAKMSAGCGQPPPQGVATGMWVRQPAGCDQGQAMKNCQAIPVGSTPALPAAGQNELVTPPCPASGCIKEGDPEWRGWWVYLPANYDSSKPYRVIYNGAGCDDPDWFDAGNSVEPYENFDDGNAILVGLDYDTFSDVPSCFDNRTPTSNDFTFMPWLMNTIESSYCVDENHQYWSGYSSGGWVAQQFNCKFPGLFRGVAAITGCEPGAGVPGSQPPCATAATAGGEKTAAFYIKDVNDTDNTYACILPACERMLTQNGCMVNGAVPKCDPMDTTITTPYTVPAGVDLAKAGGKCVSFNGCPDNYPVVFCYTTTQDHGDSQAWGGPTLLWDWFYNKLSN